MLKGLFKYLNDSFPYSVMYYGLYTFSLKKVLPWGGWGAFPLSPISPGPLQATITVYLIPPYIHVITSNNQRLWSAFDDLDSRLSLFCDVIRPYKKICGGCQIHVRPKIHRPTTSPIKSRLKFVLGVCSSNIECNN